MELKYYQAIVIVLVAFAVLSGIQVAVQTIDPTAVPEEYLPIYEGLKYLFMTSTAAILFIFLRNLLGYAENWFETEADERGKLKYEAGKLGATWTKYELMIKGYTAAIMALTIGTPYQVHAVYIAGALALVTDLITKSIRDLAPQ